MTDNVFTDEFIAGCEGTEPESVAQIYRALWRRRVEAGPALQALVVSELRLTNHDYEWLCRWVRRFPDDYYERYLIRQTLATFRFYETDLPVSRAIGLILAVTFAEHLRREGLAENASAWPVLRRLFSDEAERVLFVQRQPCDGLKQAVKDGLTRTGFGFLHRFDEEKTQSWFSTLTAQYGLSRPEIAEVRSLLVMPQKRASLMFLFEKSPRFGEFWRTLRDIREGRLATSQARQCLKESAFIPIGCAEELLMNLRAVRVRTAGGGIAVGETQDVRGLVAGWRFTWDGSSPSMRIALDVSRVGDALPGDDDVLVTMNGKFMAKLLRNRDGLSGVGERMLDAESIRPMLSFHFESGGAAREEAIELVFEDADVAFFDAVTGKSAADSSSLDPARAWICLCRSDLKLSCASAVQPLADGWMAHRIDVGGVSGATLRDANGLEVWSHAASSVHAARRQEAPLLKVEPVNGARDYLAVNSRATLRLRVIGEGEVRSVRIAGMPYAVRNTETSTFVDDVLLGANLRSRDVPFRYAVRCADQSLIGNMSVSLPIVGAFIERDGAWLPLFKRDIFAAENADEQRFRFLHSFDGPGVLYDGHRYLQACADMPLRLTRALDGLGEDLTLRPQAFNQGKDRVTIAYTCVRSGLIAWVEMREDGEYLGLKLRRPNDLIGCSLVLWSARSGLRIVGDENIVSHDEAVSQNFEVALPDGFGLPDVLALAYRGDLLGSWCFADREIWRTPPAVDVETIREWAAFFRWCRLPFNWKMISGFFGSFLRSDPLTMDALFSAELPDGLRLTPTIHGDGVMERSLRYLIDRSLPEFREWIRTPEVAQAWAQPDRLDLYRRLARVHPLLARTVYQTLTGSWPTTHTNWEIFEGSVRPQLRARFGDELDKRYLESEIEKWLTGEDASSAEMNALLCEESFASWFRAGWAQPN